MKTLFNNKLIICIPTLYHKNKNVTDFKKKAELFFTGQCSTINNSSELPINFCKKADTSILTITYNSEDISTLIQNVDPNKAHMVMV